MNARSNKEISSTRKRVEVEERIFNVSLDLQIAVTVEVLLYKCLRSSKSTICYMKPFKIILKTK